MNKNMIGELSSLKEELLSCQDKCEHKYTLWSKEYLNDKTCYFRVCEKCGFVRKIETFSPVSDIEDEIIKQNDAIKAFNYFLDTEKDVLDTSNTMFFIYIIKDYLNHLDKEMILKLKNKLKEVNSPNLDTLNEYRIVTSFIDALSDITNIPEELIQEINSYVSDYIKIESHSL